MFNLNALHLVNYLHLILYLIVDNASMQFGISWNIKGYGNIQSLYILQFMQNWN